MLLLCVLTTGCGMDNIDSMVIPVVEVYLNKSIGNNWGEIDYMLSGEALAEFKINSTRVQAQGTVADAEFKVTQLADGLAEVKADILVKYGESLDRVAYNFKLKKIKDDWKIYKTTYGSFLHPKLKEGIASSKAVDVAKKYIELSLDGKRTTGINYLAGQLKMEALRSVNIPIDQDSIKRRAGAQAKVKQVNCLGTAKGFTVLSVDYETVIDGRKYTQQAVLEMVGLGSDWKIGNIEISQ